MILRRPSRSRPAFAATFVAAAVLGACGGGSSDGGPSSADPSPPAGPGGEANDPGPVVGGPATGTEEVLIPGDIARYGVVSVGDDGTQANEIVGGFFTLSDAVAPDAFGGVLDPDSADCRVADVDARGTGFGTISANLLPSPDGVDVTSVMAGETLVLTSGAGTWTELQAGSTGGFRFYDLAPGSVLPAGPVPGDLALDVPGDDAFPAFGGAAFPGVEPLAGFAADGDVDAGTRFTWDAAATPGSKIRFSTSTAGAFFAGAGVTVSCVVPDTGEFTFPSDVRDELGSDFAGDSLVASRVSIDTRTANDALLILVRESDPAN